MNPIDSEAYSPSAAVPWWWNRVGERTFKSSKRDTSSLTYSNGEKNPERPDWQVASAHAIITKGPGDDWLVRRKVFPKLYKPVKPDQAPLFEREEAFTEDELRTAFSQTIVSENPFTRELGGEAGVKGKFIRLGPYLLIGDPLVNEPHQNMSILLKDFITRQVLAFIATGKANTY